jgi:hypothetical protein
MQLQNPSGRESWSRIYLVAVPGDPTASHDIDHWTRAVVLRVSRNAPTFTVAIRTGDILKRSRVPVEHHNGLFRVKLGPSNIEIQAIPRYSNSVVELELVEVTAIDDPRYNELPLY